MFRSVALSLTCIVIIGGGNTIARGGAPPNSTAPPRPTAAAHSSSAGDRGATYYALERSAVRATTKFADDTTAVSERDNKGRIRTKLFDVGGNQQAAADSASGTLDSANTRLNAFDAL